MQILMNAGLSIDDIYGDGEIVEGYDVKNRVYGDVYKMGIIDPVKVTRSALQNAVSVAVTILSTNAIITMARTYEAAD
jgi:chaperonin GroEL